MRGYEQEFEVTSELDRGLIRTAATLAIAIEEMEATQLRGDPVDVGDLTRLAGQLRRTLASLKHRSQASASAPSIPDRLAAGREDEEEGGA